MAEITPIIPSPTVTGIKKVERDEARKNREQKQPPEPEKTEAEQPVTDESPSNGKPRLHIDERV